MESSGGDVDGPASPVLIVSLCVLEGRHVVRPIRGMTCVSKSLRFRVHAKATLRLCELSTVAEPGSVKADKGLAWNGTAKDGCQGAPACKAALCTAV